jgi:light-regulated signal transduction histidine kinase (bacteriophytochrome)
MDIPIPPPDTVIIGPDERFFQTIEPAARNAFPGARIVTVESVKESLLQEGDGAKQMTIVSSLKETGHDAQDTFPQKEESAGAVVALSWLRAGDECPEGVEHILRCEWERHFLRNQNQKMTGDLRMIGRRIGHDIRMHLGGIVSTADLLADLVPEHGAPQWRLTRSIHHSVEEILVLLDRVKAIVMTAGPAPAGLEMIVGEAAAAEALRLQPVFDEYSAKMKLPDLWPPVRGVHPWLKVIWASLLTNAIHRAGSGAEIEAGWSRDGEWRFWVKDNGPEVEGGLQECLFPTIQSLDDLHASAHDAGLAIVRRLTEQMGGRCGYESPPEGGACFWFTLPAAAGSPDRPETGISS